MIREKKFDIVVVCHIYYPDTEQDFLKQFLLLNQYKTFFFFNISEPISKKEGFINALYRIFPYCTVVKSPDKGRDIGGKLFALDLILKARIESDLTLIIHDKRSPHLGSGQLWRKELFKIISPEYLPSIINRFKTNKRIGIVAASRFIENEYDPATNNFSCTSNNQIKFLISKYRIDTRDYNFVAGNIFWIRSSLVRDFFLDKSIYNIRAELESGNALDFKRGTVIHSWERIMSWIATSNGYVIYGI